MSEYSTTFWIGIAAAAGGVLLCAVLLGRHAAAAIAGKASANGRRVLRLSLKPIRSPFMPGLTPLGMVYRVTLQSAEPEAKTTVKLYAYDPGAWFSSQAHPVRQFSGGVWRDA